MAMNGRPRDQGNDLPPTDPGDGTPAVPDDVLARAATGLRELTDDGWVRARDSVLARVMRTLRPAQQVAGRHEHGSFTVATTVVVDRVRAALDADPAADVRVVEVRCAVGDDDELESVTVVLSVRFGARIADAARAARATTADAVSRTTGTTFPTDHVLVDLHVADVHPLDDTPR